MKSLFGLVVLSVLLPFISSAHAQPAPANPPLLLLVTQSKGFQHDVVKHAEGEQSVVEKTFAKLADQTKQFTVENIEDAATLTPDKIKSAKVIVFYTTGDLPMTDEAYKAFDQWIQDGGGFYGIHPATDTFHDKPEYIKIIGGEFIDHPWHAETTVTMKLDDPTNPTVSMFDPHFTLKEEIYWYKNFDPASVRVLMSLDMEQTALKKPKHVPVIWCKNYGKGKVYYTELGHNKAVWDSDVYQKHLTAAIGWLLGTVQADATPNPDVSKQEQDLAEKAAAAQAAAAPDAKAAEPKPKPMPTVPQGFSISTFVEGPKIMSPTGLAVTPDGKVFVGEDQYNSQPDRKMGLSDIKLCVDTNGDGVADKITTFATNINSPQGMCFCRDTLYVTHAPFLTAFKDTDGDGVADVRTDLITGFGPVPEGLVHHIPSGVHMGIDGWLYISIGDKGIKEATGTDGRKITLHGGGVVRVRPDGTELQVFCSGTRNIYDVAIDPYLNTITRDNTNDGDGWWSRLTQMQRDASIGYPNLYKNFDDEMVHPLADYGGGGATGSIYIQEPGFPGTYGDTLYTSDWARSTVYRHVLTPAGATFTVTQEDFIKGVSPTHEDVDGEHRMYVSDWVRRDWGNSTGVGAIYVVKANGAPTTEPSTPPANVNAARPRGRARPKANTPAAAVAVAAPAAPATATPAAPNPAPAPAAAPDAPSAAPVAATPVAAAPDAAGAAPAATTPTTVATTQPTTEPAEPFPDMTKLTAAQLVDQLAIPSTVRRREAQLELLHRENSPEIDMLLKASVTNKQLDLRTRVAAMFTLAQIMGATSHPFLAECVADSDLREFALRALVDRDSQLVGVDARLFADSLADPNPRVRVQAAIGIERLRDTNYNAQLVSLTDDKDPMVSHAAQQALRILGGTDACIAAITSTSNPDLIAGALRVLRTEHDHRTVLAMEKLLADDKRPVVQKESIRTLARLYYVEATWDGTWWNTRPDTRGPNYMNARWDQSSQVAQMMMSLAAVANPEIAKAAVAEIGLCSMEEAIPMLTTRIATDNPLRIDAANALIQMKESTPQLLSALQQIAQNDAFDADLRGRAATTLAGIDSPEAQAVTLALVQKLDGATQQSPILLTKMTDALAGRPTTAQQMPDILALFQNAQQPDTRIAAASSLLRGTEQPVKDRLAKLWDEATPEQSAALLTAATRVPPELVKPYQPRVEALVQAKQKTVRDPAILVLGHLGDAGTIKTLLTLAAKPITQIAAASALAEIGPDKAADDQVLSIAQLLTTSSLSLAHSSDHESYSHILAGAEKYAEDKRIPKEESDKLLVQLKRQGVIASYMRTDAIASTQPSSFDFTAAPEQNPGGPFTRFTVGDSSFDWKPLPVTDPRGVVQLGMPDNTIVYLNANYDSPTAGTAILTCGSDDGVHVWLNGKLVHQSVNTGRAGHPDTDRAPIQLQAGNNILLFKVNNIGGPSAVQARIRTRPADFEPDELAEAIAPMKGDLDRGKALFTSAGCIKCHTTDAHEEPKGPFLGDVGSKYQPNYLVESILHPSAKIAQGFSTVKIDATDEDGKGSSEYVGFVTKESADSVALRDLTGKVMNVPKARIKTRATIPGSMMPEGLAHPLTIEDFRSLLTYLQSLKTTK